MAATCELRDSARLCELRPARAPLWPLAFGSWKGRTQCTHGLDLDLNNRVAAARAAHAPTCPKHAGLDIKKRSSQANGFQWIQWTSCLVLVLSVWPVCCLPTRQLLSAARSAMWRGRGMWCPCGGSNYVTKSPGPRARSHHHRGDPLSPPLGPLGLQKRTCLLLLGGVFSSLPR